MKTMYDAIYTRQSVERVDSISIESQIEHCKYEVKGNPCKEYIDRGYSGKNTSRPAFEEMLEDIMKGKISRVVVYKLDRISRSTLDFANMMEIFKRYNVEFISTTEKFDTSTAMGRAMLSICIVFAQLERETIQKRVADAYYSRSKKGFWMGGDVPYGFSRESAAIDGIKTSMFVPIPEETEQVKLIYTMYSDPSNSLGDIVRYLNDNGIKNLRGGVWYTSRISDMLRNPVYVRADADTYEFFKSQGANLINPASDYMGYNACYLYTSNNTISSAVKRSDLVNKEVVLAPHQGIISSQDWLKCRVRCLSNRQSTKTCKGKNSWLIGKTKCGKCGYSLVVTRSGRRRRMYFTCSLRKLTKGDGCEGAGGTIYVDVLEEYLLDAIHEKLSEFTALSTQKGEHVNPRINENKVRIMQIDTDIEKLLSKIGHANEILMQYINEQTQALDTERKRLQEEILSLTYSQSPINLGKITNHVEQWEDIAFEDRQSVVDALIKVIHITDSNINITWKM